ncbi:MAG: 30S ribosomal protein S8 [Candidatus Omnitrophica bacterium]|nr:30S ribosomal protein S8 [Candidatus Omnitrophota bacterium]
MADMIADTFTIIRNATRAQKEDTLIPYSKVFARVCDILKDNGYIENFKEVDLEGYKKIKVYFKYERKRCTLTQIARVSRPGRRVFVTKNKVPSILRGFGIAIVSTSKGIFTDKEAREKNLGGELLGKVW